MPDSPTSDVNGYAPSVLEHVIGQSQAVERVKVALEAAWNDGIRFPHTLMVGPPGVGKSMLARVIASEMGVKPKETLAQTVDSPFAAHSFLLEPADRDVVFLDEADELSPRAQTMLYRAIEDRRLFVPQFTDDECERSVPLADFTILAATNNEYCLVPPLRDRFRLTLQFDYYSHDELAAILRQRGTALGWAAEEGVLEAIAARGRGTPRIALKLLEGCWRTARSVSASTISSEHFERTCQLEGLDALGLGNMERRYLRVLAESRGPVRLNILAMRLSVPSRTLCEVMEPFLIRVGLLAKSDSGREITRQGLEHLRNSEEGR